MKKTYEELKKEWDAKEQALKEMKAAVLKKAKAKNDKTANAEKAKLRKKQNHLKILIGGYVLAEIKRSKDFAILDKVAASMKSEGDKKLLADLKKSLLIS